MGTSQWDWRRANAASDWLVPDSTGPITWITGNEWTGDSSSDKRTATMIPCGAFLKTTQAGPQTSQSGKSDLLDQRSRKRWRSRRRGKRRRRRRKEQEGEVSGEKEEEGREGEARGGAGEGGEEELTGG